MITGIRNLGRTKYGLPWEGYNAQRFNDIDLIEENAGQIYFYT